MSRLSSATLAGICLITSLQIIPLQGDASSVPHCTVYSSDADDPWNAVFCAFYARRLQDGSLVGGDILDPFLWRDTDYAFKKGNFDSIRHSLERFIASYKPGEASSLKRAIFQRDMLAVADWLQKVNTTQDKSRSELFDLVSHTIRLVALTPSEIAELPITRIPSGQLTAGLSESLANELGSWVCLSERSHAPVALTHVRKYEPRSVFVVLVNVADRRDRGVDFVNRTKFLRKDSTGLQPEIPVGLTVALVRFAVLLASDGARYSTRIVEYVQLRTYTSVAEQRYFAWELRRGPLFQGDMTVRQIGESELTHSVFVIHRRDPFDSDAQSDRAEQVGYPVFSFCRECHETGDSRSFLSISRYRFGDPQTPADIAVGSVAAEIRAQVVAINLNPTFR
jgi:hypothetical protein